MESVERIQEITMIAPAPHFSGTTNINREFEYLLLGDLRQVLEEPVTPQSSRWILAILDLLLAGRPRSRPSVYLPVERRNINISERSNSLESGSLLEKLRRLRDRIAHRTSYDGLIEDLRDELRDAMLDRMSSAACLFDA